MAYSWIGTLLFVSAVGALAPGCGASDLGTAPGTAAAPRLLPQGDLALGLAYRATGTLSVRYVDGEGNPIAGATVRFDPPTTDDNGVSSTRGSTLASDQAVTDADGKASVTIIAGTDEATFDVDASAEGADPLRFVVAVSQFPFIAADVKLAYMGPRTGAVIRVRASLYGVDGKRCTDLAPTATPPASPQEETASGSAATVRFPFLRATPWTLVGRAEDAGGRPVAWGCIEFDARGLSGPVVVTIPLGAVFPSLAPRYRFSGTVSPMAAAPSPMQPWDDLTACPLAPAQQLLDAISDALGPGLLQTDLGTHRGAPDGMSCRPAMRGGYPTLDAQLATLLARNASPLAQLPAVVADVDAMAASVDIDTRADLTPAGDGTWLGRFSLEKVTLAGVGHARAASYDPRALGFPVASIDNVPIALTESALTVGHQEYTLRLPALWGRALVDVALAQRGLPGDPRALVGAIVGAATRNQADTVLTGCMAVEDLVCSTLNNGGACAIATACEHALDRLGAQLAAPFIAPDGIDFSVDGGGMGSATNGSLVADSLQGTWDTSLLIAAPARRVTPAVPWTAVQIP